MVISCNANILPPVSKLNTGEGKGRSSVVAHDICVGVDPSINVDVHCTISSDVLPQDLRCRNSVCLAREHHGAGGAIDVHRLVLRRRYDPWSCWREEQKYSEMPESHDDRMIIM